MSSPIITLEGMKEAAANTAASVSSCFCAADKVAASVIGHFSALCNFYSGTLSGYTETLDEAHDTLGIPPDLKLTYWELKPLLPERGGFLDCTDLKETGFRPFEERIENLNRVMNEIANTPAKEEREKKLVTEQKLFDLEAELLIIRGKKNQEEILKALRRRELEIYDPDFAVPNDDYTDALSGAKENRRDHIYFGIRRSLILKGYATESSGLTPEQYLDDSLVAFQETAPKGGSIEEAKNVLLQRMKSGSELGILSQNDVGKILKIMVEALIFASVQEWKKSSGKSIDIIVPEMIDSFSESGLIGKDSDSLIDFTCAVEARLDELAEQNCSSANVSDSNGPQRCLSVRSDRSARSDDMLADKDFNRSNPLKTTTPPTKAEAASKDTKTRAGIIEIQKKIQEKQAAYIDLLNEKLKPENIEEKETSLDREIVEILGEIEGLKATLRGLVPVKKYWGVFPYELLPTVAEDAPLAVIAADERFRKEFRADQKEIAKKDKQIADKERILNDDQQVHILLAEYDRSQSSQTISTKVKLKSSTAPAAGLPRSLFSRLMKDTTGPIASVNITPPISAARSPSAKSDKSLSENQILSEYEAKNTPITTTPPTQEEIALKDQETRRRVAEIQANLIEKKTKQLKSLRENTPFDVDSLEQIVGQEAEYGGIFDSIFHNEFLEKDKEIARLNDQIARTEKTVEKKNGASKSGGFLSWIGLGKKKIDNASLIANAQARLREMNIEPAKNGEGVQIVPGEKTPGFQTLHEKQNKIRSNAEIYFIRLKDEKTPSNDELAQDVVRESLRYSNNKQEEFLRKYESALESIAAYLNLLQQKLEEVQQKQREPSLSEEEKSLLQKREALLLKKLEELSSPRKNQEVLRDELPKLDNDIEEQFKNADKLCDELIVLLDDMTAVQSDREFIRRSESGIRESINAGKPAGINESSKITPKNEKPLGIFELRKKQELMDERTTSYCNLAKNHEELSATACDAVIQQRLIASSIGVCLNFVDRLKGGEKISDRDLQAQFQNAHRLCDEQIAKLNDMIKEHT